MVQDIILAIDDEEDILEVLRFAISKEGYQIECATSGREGLEIARRVHPSLIILDLMLPDVDGLDVCRQLKKEASTNAIPVIMLSAKGAEGDVVTGLEMGADDYVCKPFSPRILLARIKTVLRRPSGDKEDTLVKYQGFVIDPHRYKVSVGGGVLDLTNTEFKILYFLAKQPDLVFTRHQIVNAVHGEDYPVTDRSIDVQIVSLRKKLGPMGDLIDTVRGVGYRFKGQGK